MATVIDSLILELGLDPSKFTAGQKAAVEAFKKTKEQAEKTGKDIEESGKRAAEFFRQLRGQVLALFAAFTAGRGLKEFIQDTITTNASMGRMAKVLDTNVKTLSAWRNMAELTGGSAEGITSSIQGLVMQFQQFSLTGESSVIPYFRALGINIADAKGAMKPFSDILLELSDRFSKMDPAKAAAFGQALGLDQGTINLLIRGRPAVQAMLEEQKKLGVVTEEDAKAAADAQKAWGELTQASTSAGRTFLTLVTPAIVGVLGALKEMAEWLLQNKPVLEAVFVALTAVVTVLTVAMGTGLVTAAYAVTAAFLATPFGWVVAGIALITAAGTLLYNHWKEIGDWWTRLWGGMADSTDKSVKKVQQSTAPIKKGTKPSIAKGEPTDVEKFQSMGWSREQAIGIAANLMRESGGNANITGDNGQAYGLAQWHPDRQAAFKKWAGHDIRDSTRDEQLRFVNYELRHGDKRAGDALAQTTDAEAAAAVLSKLYERPKDVEGEASTRAALAAAMQRAPGSVLPLGAAAAASSPSTTNNSSMNTNTSETNIDTINIQTQATDADAIAQSIAPAIKRSSFAQQANTGQQ